MSVSSTPSRLFSPRLRRRLTTAVLVVWALATAAACAVPAGAMAQAGAPPRASNVGALALEAEIARLAEIAGGTVGVAAVHLETGRSAFHNGGAPFPMASSYKVPIAVELLTRVDSGVVSLDSMIALTPGDLHPGSGTLTELFDDPGVILSLRNLLELMLLISDNSATDIVLRAAGGPAAVTARMRALGLPDIRVDRPTVRLIGDWIGVTNLPGDDVAVTRFRELSRAVSDEQRKTAAAAFDKDPRDTSTPEAMARLLALIHGGRALSPASSELLLDIMQRSTTGAGRIKGMLPPDTRVSHKTGTIGGTTNDVGIILLPGNAGHVATVVFVKESTRPVEARERAIAQISRAIYDYFLFVPAAPAAATR